MKMVSAAKLKKTDAITAMRPYAEKLTELLQNLSATLEGDVGEYTTQREVKKVLVVAITSKRFCGAFNSIIKASKPFWFYAKQVDVFCNR
jgi:F-type H+-transporting ATPase subunit gamma